MDIVRSALRLTAAAAFVAIAAAGTSPALAQADYPAKPLDVITHNEPGAVMDIMGRLIAQIVQDDHLLSQPIVIVNRPGGGGARALAAGAQKPKDPYTFLIMPTNTILRTPLVQDLPFTYKNFTPIANLVTDGSMLFVKADAPYKTMDELIDYARAHPGKMNMSVTNLDSHQAYMSRQIFALKGISWEFVTFDSGPDGVLAVLNGSVDIGFANPFNIRQYVKAGTLRPLMAGSTARYPDEFASVPTIEELGLGKAAVSYRGFFGAPDMPDYAVKTAETMLKKVFEDKRFKDYMAQNMMTPQFIPAAEYGPKLDALNAEMKAILASAKK
jgi:putative tricarboxylic transport membrane protein